MSTFLEDTAMGKAVVLQARPHRMHNNMEHKVMEECYIGQARMVEDRDVYRVLVGKPEGKRPMGRPSHRWEDNIKMDLQEDGRGVMGTGWSWLRIGAGGGHLCVR
jgi:hypothetical protein